MLNYETALRIGTQLKSPACFLFTSQTRTAANLLRQAFDTSKTEHMCCIHQMAPFDSPGIAKRFLAYWRPDLALFAEGDIWPNLLDRLRHKAIPTYLINARMTRKTLRNWHRFAHLARHVFCAFQAILASNQQTAQALSALTSVPVVQTGNLKTALPPPQADSDDLRLWSGVLQHRTVLLAASTHAPEEIQLMEAWQLLVPRPFLILAPRHPERGDALANMLTERGLSFSRRSLTRAPNAEADILLADTIGEMGLWYRLADAVYVGGGHADGIGGHNPLEPLRLERPVLTGPKVYNFQELNDQLVRFTGYTVLPTLADLPQYFPANPPEAALTEYLEDRAEQPMQATLDTLKPALQRAGLWA